MEHESQSQSSSENDCYSTNEEYFLDICRFGEFDEIKDFLSTLNVETKFDWEWASNTGDNFVHMLAGNNFPDIFVFLIKELESRSLKDKLPALINKQNATGNTPLRTFLMKKKDYAVITDSKDMLLKLLEYGADPSITNEFGRTALDEAEMIQKFEIAEILAPVTKPDIEKLKKEFGAMDVCNEDSSEDEDEEEKVKEEKSKEDKGIEKIEDKKEE